MYTGIFFDSKSVSNHAQAGSQLKLLVGNNCHFWAGPFGH
jgi:hypothetical protein